MLVALLCLLLAPASHPQAVERIAFGSCIRETQPVPILATVAAFEPDVFIFLGDNVYADTDNAAEMTQAYADLLAKPEVQRLIASSRVLWVWDDHDYGLNDAGREWPFKERAKTIMLDAVGEPVDSPRRQRAGNYDAVTVGPDGQRVQFLLLDTRYFRSPLERDPTAKKKSYIPTADPLATVLGEEQWAWLEAQLAEPAELRIVCSSIQVLANEHRFEKWANHPADQERLLDLLGQAGGASIIFSGDRHSGEISRTTHDNLTVLDVTSSALNQPRGGDAAGEPNRFRIGDMHLRPNFGALEIDWSKRTVTATLRAIDGDTLESAEMTF